MNSFGTIIIGNPVGKLEETCRNEVTFVAFQWLGFGNREVDGRVGEDFGDIAKTRRPSKGNGNTTTDTDFREQFFGNQIVELFVER